MADFEFLSLPLELRQAIYKEILILPNQPFKFYRAFYPDRSEAFDERHKSRPRKIPKNGLRIDLLLVNRQIHSESIQFLYKNAIEFNISYGYPFIPPLSIFHPVPQEGTTPARATRKPKGTRTLRSPAILRQFHRVEIIYDLYIPPDIWSRNDGPECQRQGATDCLLEILQYLHESDNENSTPRKELVLKLQLEKERPPAQLFMMGLGNVSPYDAYSTKRLVDILERYQVLGLLKQLKSSRRLTIEYTGGGPQVRSNDLELQDRHVQYLKDVIERGNSRIWL